MKNSHSFLIKTRRISHIALLYHMHHVHVHLCSRLDSRYKSSGNVEGRQREGQRSNGGKDPVDCQQILDRCRVACANVWTKCRSAETRTYESRTIRIRITPRWTHMDARAYKRVFGTLTQRQNCVHKTQADWLSQMWEIWIWKFQNTKCSAIICANIILYWVMHI